jgi:predicted peroxiredoxin
MKKLLFAVLGLISFLFSTPALAEPHKNIVTIVTSPNAQTQLMAMVLTMQAVKQGANAHILLCDDAGDMALKDAPKTVTAPQKPKGMSPQKLMKLIMEKTKTKVEVCALYLPNKDMKSSNLIDGITAANPQKMGQRLLVDNVRILSF